MSNNNEPTVDEILSEYEDVKVFSDNQYASAIVGVTTDNRVVYDYNKMVEWLMEKENMSDEEAEDWISYNTIRALPYFGENAPIIMNSIE